MIDSIVASMVNRGSYRESVGERIEREEFDKAIDEHIERFGENVDCPEPIRRKVEDGSHNEHYGEMTLEPLDVAQHWLGNEQLEGAYLFQIIKYLGRYQMKAQGKGGKIDLLKMRDYLNLLIEMIDEG